MGTKLFEGNVWRIRQAFQDVHFTFAQEPGFRERGPAAFLAGELYSSTFNEPADEALFWEKARHAQEDTGRAIFKKGMTRDGKYVAIRADDGTLLVLFGWEWDDAQAFLLAVASQTGLTVPHAARLETLAKNKLSPATRALLL